MILTIHVDRTDVYHIHMIDRLITLLQLSQCKVIIPIRNYMDVTLRSNTQMFYRFLFHSETEEE